MERDINKTGFMRKIIKEDGTSKLQSPAIHWGGVEKPEISHMAFWIR